MKSRKLLLLFLAPMVLTNCSVSGLIDDAIDRERDKDDVHRHLRHGDSIREAQRGAFEDQFFRWAGQY